MDVTDRCTAALKRRVVPTTTAVPICPETATSRNRQEQPQLVSRRPDSDRADRERGDHFL